MKQPDGLKNYWRDYWSGKRDIFAANQAESGSRYPQAFSEWVHRVEVKTIFERCRPGPEDCAADFGAGGGRFSLALARLVRRVYAVEHSQLHEVLTANAAPFGNISCLKCSIQDAVIPDPCSIALISGVLMYATDAGAEAILAKAAQSLAQGGMLVLREPMQSGGVININGKLYRPGDAYVIEEDKHFEWYRDSAWYVETAGKHGLLPVGGCISHAPVLYFLPGFIPFKTRIHARMARLLADERNFTLMDRYDRIMRGPYGLIRRLLRKKSMRFLFFKKT